MWINELELELGQSVASLDSWLDEQFIYSKKIRRVVYLVFRVAFSCWSCYPTVIPVSCFAGCHSIPLHQESQICDAMLSITKKKLTKINFIWQGILKNGTCIRVFKTPYLMSGQLVRLRVHNLYFEWKFNCFYILIIKVSIKARCSHGQNWLY